MKQRIWTAMILIPIVFYIILTKYTFLFWLFTLVVSWILIWELTSFFREYFDQPLKIALYIITTVFFFFKFYIMEVVPINMEVYSLILTLFSFFSFFAIGTMEIFRRDFQYSFYRITISGFILLYGVGAFSLFYDMRKIHTFFHYLPHDIGKYYVLYSLLICIFFDSGAYFFGKWIGEKRLGLAASPNKTWMGLLGGMISSILGIHIYMTFLKVYYPSYELTIFYKDQVFIWVLTLIVGFLSQIGDLIISVLKRNINIKDSSNLIPGHGGLLDRVDSLLPTSVFVFFSLVIYEIGFSV